MAINLQRLCLCFALLAGIIGATTAHADFEVTAGVSIMNGETITERGNFPEGKGDALTPTSGPVFPTTTLTLPLKGVILATCDLRYISQDWILGASVKQNANDPITYAESSEGAVWSYSDGSWSATLYNDNPGSDVTEEINTDLEALLARAYCRYRLYTSSPTAEFESISYYGGVGFDQRKFTYDGDVERTYSNLTGVWAYDATIPAYLKYEVTYSIPYFELAASGQTNKAWSFGANIGFSPFVKVKDNQENNLLRPKGPYSAESDLDGTAYLCGIDMHYRFAAFWSVDIFFDYLKILATGDQVTVCSAGSIGAGTSYEITWPEDSWRNDTKIRSEQFMLGLSTSFRF